MPQDDHSGTANNSPNTSRNTNSSAEIPPAPPAPPPPVDPAQFPATAGIATPSTANVSRSNGPSLGEQAPQEDSPMARALEQYRHESARASSNASSPPDARTHEQRQAARSSATRQ